MSGVLPISPEMAKKREQILEKVSPSALFDEQILEQTSQNLMKVSENEFSPEQLQQIHLQLPQIITQLKFIIIQLKQDKLIDSELAGSFCTGLKEFDIARTKNTITKEKKEKLENTLSLVKKKLINLISTKKIDSLIAKPLILLLSTIHTYMKTISTKQMVKN
ncbi:MAG: hypothetical protein ACRCU0_05255 [Candidatus Rhabdochlamydia sp.]